MEENKQQKAKHALVIAAKTLAKKKWFLALCGTSGAVIAGLVVIFILIFAVIGANQNNQTSYVDFGGGGMYEIELTEEGKRVIPEEYIPIYQAAAAQYGLPWTLLAGVHRIETVFSTIPNMISPVGATGHMQFMPCTWLGWGHPTCGGLGLGSIPKSTLTNMDQISKYGGYGVDGDGDGKADPDNINDAIFAAANYLSASGGAEGDFRGALFNYNRASWYVDEVMGFFDSWTASMTKVDGGGTADSGKPGNNKVIEKAIQTGTPLVGNSPYVWGGGRSHSDVANRRFDCSSFIRWIFHEGGVTLGPLTSTTTDTLAQKGRRVSINNIQRGDIIFFDTYKKNGHVAIYLGDGRFLHDSSSKGVNINKMSERYWTQTFKGHVRRVT